MKHPVLYTIIILILIGAFASSGNNSNTNTTTKSSTPTQKQETVYAVGDTITNGDYEITIQNVNEAKKVGTQYLNSSPAEGGIYVCVDFNYKNISSQPINSWKFPTIALVDSSNVEYSSDISASSYYATEKDPDRKVLSDLNPGITVTDNKVFEISSESYNQGEWYLVVDKDIKIKVK